MTSRLEKAWYSHASWTRFLSPLATLYGYVVKKRRQQYLTGQREVWQPNVPLVIVGNITVGGTGKSPLVARLVRDLQEKGFTPGVVSRGYGGKAKHYPLLVTANTDVAESGDEPLMLAKQTACPVAVDPKRASAARLLIEQQCDVILSDDGLQHYAMGRTLELVVIDTKRGLGNQALLPQGPLREPVSRLCEVDALIFNGDNASSPEIDCRVPSFIMQVRPIRWRHLLTQQAYPLDKLPFVNSEKTVAIAGMGNPQRFFNTLHELGVDHRQRAFKDHHHFVVADLPESADVILMTAKDAVKCLDFADERCWVLEVEADVSAQFLQWWDAQTDSWLADASSQEIS